MNTFEETARASIVVMRAFLGILAGAVILVSCEPLDSKPSDKNPDDPRPPATKSDPTRPGFGNQRIPTQHYVAGVAIPHLVLPQANGGVAMAR